MRNVRLVIGAGPCAGESGTVLNEICLNAEREHVSEILEILVLGVYAYSNQKEAAHLKFATQ